MSHHTECPVCLIEYNEREDHECSASDLKARIEELELDVDLWQHLAEYAQFEIVVDGESLLQETAEDVAEYTGLSADEFEDMHAGYSLMLAKTDDREAMTVTRIRERPSDESAFAAEAAATSNSTGGSA